MSDIEKEFFEAFEVEKVRECELRDECFLGFAHPCSECDVYGQAYEVYPPITSDIVLGLEEILFKSVFYDGIHIHAPYDNEYNTKWSYQLTYYKGGYYTCGYGDTRKEALLDQFMLIMEDSDVEQEEKYEISEEVKELFKC